MTGHLARGSFEGRDAAEVGEGGFGADPFGVVAGGDQQDGRDFHADAVEGEQTRRGLFDEGTQEPATELDLGVEVLDAPSEFPQRDLGGIDDDVGVGPWPQGRGVVDELHLGEPQEPSPDLLRCGEGQVAHLDQRRDALVASRALHHDQGPDGFRGAVSGLGDPRRAPGLGRPCGLDGIHGVGLASPGSGLTVGTVDLENLDVMIEEEPCEARAIGAGALHTDALDAPEVAQPGEQLFITSSRRRELTNTEQTPDRIQRGGDMDIQMRIDPANHGAIGLYDGHVAIPSLD
jgi:hypothetical protein